MKLTQAAALLVTLSSSRSSVQAFAPASFGIVKSTYTATSTQLDMADPIKMPALSSTMKEGKIVSWLKSEGDPISAGDAIMVVESDKADMDVEAFEDGFLAKILVEEGETANVGANVALIAESEDEIASVAAAGDSSSAAVEEAAAPAEEAAAEVAAAGYSVPVTEIFMPALSSTMKEGKIVSWLKSEGDAVASGEPIMVVESDKADMDVESFDEGYIAKILVDEGDTADVGALVAVIVENEGDIASVQSGPIPTGGASAPAPAAAAPAAAAPKPAAAPKKAVTSNASAGGRVVISPLAKKRAEELGIDVSTIVGTGPNGRITGADVEAAAKGGAPKKAAAAPAPSKPKYTPAPGVIAATPMARELAKKKKIDLSTIEGTGSFGRVTEKDVKIAAGEIKPEKKKAAAAGGAPVVELRDDMEPFTGMQKAVSKNMEASLSVPIFRVSRTIVTNNFDALYQKLKPKGVSVSALLSKAVAMAVEKHPIMNSNYDPSGGTKWNADINIAMAVAIDGGLITPTIKNANERTLLDIGEDWRSLVEKAKTGGLKPDDYQSGTFTISNLGMFGVSQFDAILPPGQGSILAIGGTQEVVVPDKAAVLGLKTQKQMTVTLTCDHRQIYGADAALFLKTLADIMENKINDLPV